MHGEIALRRRQIAARGGRRCGRRRGACRRRGRRESRSGRRLSVRRGRGRQPTSQQRHTHPPLPHARLPHVPPAEPGFLARAEAAHQFAVLKPGLEHCCQVLSAEELLLLILPLHFPVKAGRRRFGASSSMCGEVSAPRPSPVVTPYKNIAAGVPPFIRGAEKPIQTAESVCAAPSARPHVLMDESRPLGRLFHRLLLGTVMASKWLYSLLGLVAAARLAPAQSLPLPPPTDAAPPPALAENAEDCSTCADAFAPPCRAWLSAEYLLWKLPGENVPVLAGTIPSAQAELSRSPAGRASSVRCSAGRVSPR